MLRWSHFVVDVTVPCMHAPRCSPISSYVFLLWHFSFPLLLWFASHESRVFWIQPLYLQAIEVRSTYTLPSPNPTLWGVYFCCFIIQLVKCEVSFFVYILVHTNVYVYYVCVACIYKNLYWLGRVCWGWKQISSSKFTTFQRIHMYRKILNQSTLGLRYVSNQLSQIWCLIRLSACDDYNSSTFMNWRLEWACIWFLVFSLFSKSFYVCQSFYQ